VVRTPFACVSYRAHGSRLRLRSAFSLRARVTLHTPHRFYTPRCCALTVCSRLPTFTFWFWFPRVCIFMQLDHTLLPPSLRFTRSFTWTRRLPTHSTTSVCTFGCGSFCTFTRLLLRVHLHYLRLHTLVCSRLVPTHHFLPLGSWLPLFGSFCVYTHLFYTRLFIFSSTLRLQVRFSLRFTLPHTWFTVITPKIFTPFSFTLHTFGLSRFSHTFCRIHSLRSRLFDGCHTRSGYVSRYGFYAHLPSPRLGSVYFGLRSVQFVCCGTCVRLVRSRRSRLRLPGSHFGFVCVFRTVYHKRTVCSLHVAFTVDCLRLWLHTIHTTTFHYLPHARTHTHTARTHYTTTPGYLRFCAFAYLWLRFRSAVYTAVLTVRVRFFGFSHTLYALPAHTLVGTRLFLVVRSHWLLFWFATLTFLTCVTHIYVC